MRLNAGISHDTRLAEIPKPLRDAAECWMKTFIGDYDRDFDMAVDCAHDMELVPCPMSEDTWDIPVYLIELAEELKS